MKQSDYFINITCKKMNVTQAKSPKAYWVFFVLLSALYLVAFSASSFAAEEKRKFDHFNTGFPLSGQHQTLQCATCHLKGVFKGTPKTCAACHNGSISAGKPSGHVASAAGCDDCHTIFSW